MENKVNSTNNATEEVLSGFKKELYDNLILAINNQKEENVKLQNQLTEIKNEKKIIQEKILEGFK